MLLHQKRILRASLANHKAGLLIRTQPFQPAIVTRHCDVCGTRFLSRINFKELDPQAPRLVFRLNYGYDAMFKLDRLKSLLGLPRNFPNQGSAHLFPHLPVDQLAICVSTIQSYNIAWEFPIPALFPDGYPEQGGKTWIGLVGDITPLKWHGLVTSLTYQFRKSLAENGVTDKRTSEFRRTLRLPLCDKVLSSEEAQDKAKILQKMYPKGISLGRTRGASLTLINILPLGFGIQNKRQSRLIWDSQGPISDDPTKWPPQERKS